MPAHPVTCPPHANAALVLADGSIYFGHGVGKPGETAGELCFNTAITGYQEILTDPSYAGQIVTFTFPHIGNAGTNDDDVESASVAVRGLILREPLTAPSSFRATSDFDSWLKHHNITGISGIDTRALTHKLRQNGPQNAVIHYSSQSGHIDTAALQRKAAQWPPLASFDLTTEVGTNEPIEWTQTTWQADSGHQKLEHPQFHVVALDFGSKYNTLRHLAARGCAVTLLPPHSSLEDILSHKPDGVFLSNGPGDPQTTARFTTPVIQALIARGMPLFGICLGHQLIALALGARTEKMAQGHRGANHPIRHERTGKVEITSQNHGYVVSETPWPEGVEITHRSLFDGTIAGLAMGDKPVFAVQYHPESSPGPHDSHYLFDQFIRLMEQQPHTAAANG